MADTAAKTGIVYQVDEMRIGGSPCLKGKSDGFKWFWTESDPICMLTGAFLAKNVIHDGRKCGSIGHFSCAADYRYGAAELARSAVVVPPEKAACCRLCAVTRSWSSLPCCLARRHALIDASWGSKLIRECVGALVGRLSGVFCHIVPVFERKALLSLVGYPVFLGCCLRGCHSHCIS